MCLIYKFIFFTIASSGIVAKPSKRMEFVEIVETKGCTGEYHHVITEDGYILRIDRITSCALASSNHYKPVVFLQHGLFAVSDQFVMWERNNSLAFALADAGYDVWLGNFRGSTNSKGHVTMSPDTKPFWNFTRHERSVRDLPAMIDYVLDTTGTTQLTYVGHSCGASAGLSLLAEKPEYNEKIDILINLAPVAYWDPMDTLLLRPGMNAGIEALRMFLEAPDYAVEITPADSVITLFCNIIVADKFCALILNTFVGHPSVPFNEVEAGFIATYLPAGLSLKVLNHMRQNINSDKFAQYDYEDKSRNNEIYGQDEPPMYDMSKITTPTAIFRSDGDHFATEKNVAKLLAVLPNVVSHTVISDPKFTHIDYFFHRDAKAMYIDQVLQLINQYKS